MSEVPIQRRNLESEMLFLRQQHAKTLKGMHEEIKVLQKRCTDLTFKLTMQGLQTDDPSEIEAAEEKIQTLEKELESIKCNEGNIVELLKKERDEVKKLEIQLKYQTIKHNQEVTAKDKELTGLRSDLDSKAAYIAHLSTELHKMKIQQKLEENLSLKSKEKVAHPGPVVPPPTKSGGGSGGGSGSATGNRHSKRGGAQHVPPQKSRSDDLELNDGTGGWRSPASSLSSSGRSSTNSRGHHGGLHQSNPRHNIGPLQYHNHNHNQSFGSQDLVLADLAAPTPPFSGRDHYQRQQQQQQHRHRHHHHHQHQQQQQHHHHQQQQQQHHHPGNGVGVGLGVGGGGGGRSGGNNSSSNNNSSNSLSSSGSSSSSNSSGSSNNNNNGTTTAANNNNVNIVGPTSSAAAIADAFGLVRSTPSPSSPSQLQFVKSKPASRLLPPIRQSNKNCSQIVHQKQNLQHVYVKNVVRPHCFRKQAPSSGSTSCECNGSGAGSGSGTQLETLAAVESIARFDNGWRGNHHHHHHHHHHTKSAEYK
ncbi:hypothetical protein Ahia01_001414300 [Argonauta hians]